MIDSGGGDLARRPPVTPWPRRAAGYAESEPADWWKAVTACAREAVTEAVDASSARPSAVGLSGQMPAWSCRPGMAGPSARPVWADSRATGFLGAYRRLGAQALARLANPLTPGMTGPMLKSIAENEPRPTETHAGRWPRKTGSGPG